MSHSQGWLHGTHLATRFCTCFAALLTLSAGAYPQAASEPIRAASAGDSSVTPQPISIDEVSAALARLPRLSGFVALQHGEIIHQQYARGGAFAKPINIKSASKSILNALTAIALQRGDLPSLDTPISGYLPQYFAPIPKNDKRRTITVRHLLTMSSGLPSTSIYNYGEWVSSRDWIAYALNQDLVYEPGSRMTYSTGDTHLLAAVLANAVGMSLRVYAQRHLFDALGVQIGGWDRDPQGNYFGGNNMALSPQALLAFGRLYLDGGIYEARRVLSKDWIDASWTPRFLNSSFNARHDYGYLWWHTRYAGHSAWFAWGYGGQFLFVLPSLSAIVVFTGDPDARTRGGNDAIYAVMERTIVPHLAQRSVP
jgi:CubicO group peptidase (beta-lactamase class C family)